MKSIIISVLTFSLAFFLVTCEYESPPTQNITEEETQSLSKKLKLEHITFTGDLVGDEDVLGCCPNAGPSPDYTLTLMEKFEELSGTYFGEIFMNFTGSQSPGDYMVQFSYGSMYLEIRGGSAYNDRRNKILTVTFEQVPCEIWIGGVQRPTILIDFILTRSKL